MNNKETEELRRLYPGLSDEELEEVQETLTRYAALLVRMVERRHNERKGSNGGNGVK